MIVAPVVSADASTFWKLATFVESPLVWSALVRSTVAAARSHQRVGAGAAVQRDFGAPIGYGIVAGAWH